ncbi:hypothetical protein [uncultured Clostridium sp.]|uniref:hypothetical protein n=1 Tax=uncultured Clostridium sp. TaxID=59620 RepID=UPI00261B0963|nr:hypothetical protein [uncultured Clostridium sp.]
MNNTFKWLSRLGLFLIFISIVLVFTSISKIIIVILAFGGLFLFVLFAAKSTTFICSECHKEFKSTPLDFFLGLNTGNSKLLKCPHCGVRNSCSPSRKKSN